MEEEAISEKSDTGKFGIGLSPGEVALVLGGARSGKSRFAETLIGEAGDRTYIATAEAHDDEMRARIDNHRSRRRSAWRTLDAPLDLVGALTEADALGDRVLVDCLTLWLSNLMETDRDIDGETDRLMSCLTTITCPVVLVSNEVGQGIVPANALARRFRDRAGLLNQAVASIADRVYFVTAGIPAQLK